MKTCAFITVGCKVNQYETQSLREQFLRSGFEEVEPDQKADYYIINTCTVTHHSDRDSRNLMRKSRALNPQAKIIVTGCYADRDAKALEELNCADYIIPNSQKSQIVNLITKSNEELPKKISYFKGHDRAFVKIQDGCNNFCSYCVVPFVRGRSRSRDLIEIKNEVKDLIENNFSEIVLCGICLGDYGKDIGSSLVDLLKNLAGIPGNFRIRLSSIEPKDISDDLIELISLEDKICPHLHIPFQSGDDRILKAMNRPYSHKEMVRLCRKLYKKIPSLCISADIIVGFPSESQRNFENTVNLLKKIRPLRTHIFTYSPRPGTRAADFQNSLPFPELKRRRDYLKRLSAKLSWRCRKRFLGKDLRVLLESESRQNLLKGYSDNYIEVHLAPKNIPLPSLILAKVKKVNFDSTEAQFVT